MKPKRHCLVAILSLLLCLQGAIVSADSHPIHTDDLNHHETTDHDHGRSSDDGSNLNSVTNDGCDHCGLCHSGSVSFIVTNTTSSIFCRPAELVAFQAESHLSPHSTVNLRPPIG